jgi:hypothetical protein
VPPNCPLLESFQSKPVARENDEQQCKKAKPEPQALIHLQYDEACHLGGSRQMRQKKRVGKNIHHAVEQDGYEHTALRVVENPGEDESGGHDPEYIDADVSNAWHRPLPAKPDRRMPKGAEQAEDQT